MNRLIIRNNALRVSMSRQGPAGTAGATGPSIELQIDDDYIQWRVTGGDWANLLAVAALVGATGAAGAAGATVELQNSGTHIQYRVVGSPTWISLVALSALVGPTGAAGPNTVTAATTTNLTGILKGDGANVAVATGAELRAIQSLATTDDVVFDEVTGSRFKAASGATVIGNTSGQVHIDGERLCVGPDGVGRIMRDFAWIIGDSDIRDYQGNLRIGATWGGVRMNRATEAGLRMGDIDTPDVGLFSAVAGKFRITAGTQAGDLRDLDLRDLIASGSIIFPAYTAAAANALVGVATNAVVTISNEVGGRTLALYDGANWKRQTDLATIST